MDNKIKQLIDDHSHKFSEWIDIVNFHNQRYSSEIELTIEERVELSEKVVNVLGEISELFFEYGAFRDKFDNSKMYLNLYGPSLIIKSSKTDCTFYFGIDNNGFYLHTYLKHSDNLRYMDDTFYKDIFFLNDLGDFKLIENEFYSGETRSKYPDFFNNNKSSVFRLLRNYFVGTVENERNIILGDFQISWTYDANFYDIISNGCIAFKALYKLNYSLWKVYDQQTRKKKTGR
ncbi:MAG: hypothetical protein JNK09_12170 [Prolixibacteraceae bacterium]|nr:hypothetical protein [Prolixibacteraceae bacterium]